MSKKVLALHIDMDSRIPQKQEDDSPILTEGLAAATRHGRQLADEAIVALDSAVDAAIADLQWGLASLRDGSWENADTVRTLASQLASIQSSLEFLPDRLRSDLDSLPDQTFSITLFGRTTAGKSSLMTVLTHGDGSQIGNGSQRTTRDVRTYSYRGLEVTDVPGIAAFGGEKDEDAAFVSAQRSDLVLFLLLDSPQLEEAQCLGCVRGLGKPVACIVNVRRGISAESIECDQDIEDFVDDLDELFGDSERLDGIRRSMIDYGPQLGQDWSDIPFAFAHIKAACLSQLPSLSRWSGALFEASRFIDVEKLIADEARRKASLFRVKTYADTVTVPLLDAMVELYVQCLQNSARARILEQKLVALSSWKDDFAARSQARVDAFVSECRSKLRAEAAAFSEDNFDKKDAGRRWRQAVAALHLDDNADGLLSGLANECGEELQEVGREVDYELNLSKGRDDRGGSSLRGHAVVDYKRIWKWGMTAASAGIGLAGIFTGGPMLVVAGVAVGAVDLVGEHFLKDYESEKNKARKSMERTLYARIDQSMKKLRRALMESFESDICGKMLGETICGLDSAAVILLKLSETQRGLVEQIRIQVDKLNYAVFAEALDQAGLLQADVSARVIRIPGDVCALISLQDAPLKYEDAPILGTLLAERFFLLGPNPGLQEIGQLLPADAACKVRSFDFSTMIDNARFNSSTEESGSPSLAFLRLAIQVPGLLPEHR